MSKEEEEDLLKYYLEKLADLMHSSLAVSAFGGFIFYLLYSQKVISIQESPIWLQDLPIWLRDWIVNTLLVDYGWVFYLYVPTLFNDIRNSRSTTIIIPVFFVA